MSKTRHSKLSRTVLMLASILISALITPRDGNAQERVEDFKCSASEISIDSASPTKIEDVAVFIGNPPPGSDTICSLTFTTEAATQSETQLMLLSYVLQPIARFDFPPTPTPTAECISPTASPVLSRVSGGFDETHTFISPGFGRIESSDNVFTRISPCLSRTFPETGAFRIRNHCLIVACQQRKLIP